MHRSGGVLPSDYIWVEGAPTWVPVADYLGAKKPAVLPPLSPAPPVPARGASGPPPLPQTEPVREAAEERLIAQVEAGGRFVIYSYCISVFVMTFKLATVDPAGNPTTGITRGRVVACG